MVLTLFKCFTVTRKILCIKKKKPGIWMSKERRSQTREDEEKRLDFSVWKTGDIVVFIIIVTTYLQLPYCGV